MVKRARDVRKGFFISDEERKRADDTKKNVGLKDHQIYNLGVLAAEYGFGKPAQRGPIDDPMIALHSAFKFDAKLRNLRCENCGYNYKHSGKLGGTVCPRCSYNSKELRRKFRRVVCEVCGATYYTARAKGASKCHNCGNIVKEIQQFRWKQPKSTGPRQDSTTVSEEEYQGNLTFTTLSKRARLYHNISEAEWDLLSESERENLIWQLPGEKRRAGGEPMGDEGGLNREHIKWRLDQRKSVVEDMKKKTRKMEERNKKYLENREV